jgi:hypothetical protein
MEYEEFARLDDLAAKVVNYIGSWDYFKSLVEAEHRVHYIIPDHDVMDFFCSNRQVICEWLLFEGLYDRYIQTPLIWVVDANNPRFKKQITVIVQAIFKHYIDKYTTNLWDYDLDNLECVLSI